MNVQKPHSFPSAACETCKVRRIKCDETKPSCQKCTKSRRVCLETGAAKQVCFSIHIENRYASGETKRPRGPRSHLTIPRPPVDLQTRALGYYLQYHLQTLKNVPNLTRGVSESISIWKISGGTSSMVDLALSSIALAVYSRTHQHQLAATEASTRYHHLLRVAQEQIGHLVVPALDERIIDACLLAVSLMCQYEGATHRSNPTDPLTSLPSQSHHDGAMAILKFWSDNLSDTAPTFIIKQTRRGLIKASLLRNLPLPGWILNGNRFGENDLELEYDRILVRIVNLHYKAMVLQQNNSLQIAKAEEMNNEAQELDRALEDWTAQIHSTCLYKRHILPEPGILPRRHFYSSIVYSYFTPGHAAAWSHCFAIRMLIDSTRLRVLCQTRANQLNDFTHNQQRLECVTRLGDMADKIASSLPFSIERFKVDKSSSPAAEASITFKENGGIKPHLASLTTWPLTIASSVKGIDARQQKWFRSELAGLGRIIGDGVLECAETDQWVTL